MGDQVSDGHRRRACLLVCVCVCESVIVVTSIFMVVILGLGELGCNVYLIDCFENKKKHFRQCFHLLLTSGEMDYHPLLFVCLFMVMHTIAALDFF